MALLIIFVEIATLRDKLMKLGFKKHKLVIIAVHVDDLIILAEDDEEMDEIKRILKAESKMMDMGELESE